MMESFSIHTIQSSHAINFNHSKSGVVTFGESKSLHCKSMKERAWALGDDKVHVSSLTR